MAFHDKKKDGPMKLKLICTTKEVHNPAEAKALMEAHEQAVNAFNANHNVFFNQEVNMRYDEKNDVWSITSPILYADGPNALPPIGGK